MTIDQIKEIGRRLLHGIHPSAEVVRIYAYGSRVRGDDHIGSDLDFLIELRQVTPAVKREILDRAWELSLDEGYVISVVLVHPEAFEKGPLSRSAFAENIRREGVEIAA